MSLMPLNIERDGSHIVITNDPRDEMFDTSIANGIKRAVMATSYCYSFTEEITDRQKELYNKSFGTKFLKEEKNYTVTQSNRYSIQFLSHRISRVPIFLGPETRDLIEDDIYFMIVSRNGTKLEYQQPYVHKKDEPWRVHTRDFIGVRVKDGGETEELSPDEMALLFPLNVHFITLYKGDFLHFIAKPSGGYRYDNTRYIPCPVRYHFIPRADSDKTSVIERAKDWIRRDKFDNPEQIQLRFEYNGKKDIIEAITDGIDYLVKQLLLFKKEYADPSSDIVVKEESVAGLQIVKVFNNPEDDTEREADYLADFTVSNIISSHFLYYVINKLFEIYGGNDKALLAATERILVSHKKPHPRPRIMEVHIELQIPHEDKSFMDAIGAPDLQTARSMILDEVIDNAVAYLKHQSTVISAFSA